MLKCQQELTPVCEEDGLLLKRDDFYAPYGVGDVNGGKLRQAVMLIESIRSRYNSILSYCSIHSPQAPITAAASRMFDLPCTILYGGTSVERLRKLPMPRLALNHKARVIVAAKSGRHNVLYAKAKEIAERENSFIVHYGINITGYTSVLYNAVAAQVENIPDRLDNLVLTCGSGITAIGVMLGIKRFNKSVESVHLVATAPNRVQFINKALSEHDACREFIYHDLFSQPGFIYEKPARATWGKVKLHPHYEAKTMLWFCNSGIKKENSLFWIVGAEPDIRRCA